MSLILRASLLLSMACAAPSLPVRTERETNATTEPTPGPNETVRGQLQQRTLTVSQQVDGERVDRFAIVQGSDALTATAPVPVMFYLHGHGGSADEWLEMSDTIQRHVRDGEYIAVFPQGHLNSWNMGTEASTADDVAFLEMLLDELAQLDTVDLTRVYIQGLSNGAGMAHTAAIRSDQITGIAAYMTALYDDVRPREGAPPVQVLQMHGTEDDICPYDGGFSPETGHDFMSAEDSAATWASANQCAGAPEVQQQGDIDVMTWSGCRAGGEVVHYRLRGRGHDVPWEIDPFDVAWQFLRQAP